jgi:uncharacterized protein YdcH (DUF465 family)
MDEQKIKEVMIVKNAEFKKLYEEHKKHEETLKILKSKPVLSETEKLEEKELKKMKLVLKDRMYQMMAEYRKSL